MLSQRTSRVRSSSYERSVSEGLVDLHVYVIPAEQWKNHVSSVLNQLITDSVSAGYIRVHPESVLFDLRREINEQLGFESVPRDYVFLRCLGRSFTQVKPRQERELKSKYFMPPHTYSPELYVVDADATQRSSTSSQSSQRSFTGGHTVRHPLPPPSYPVATRPYVSPDNGYNDRERENEILRREDPTRRKRLQEEDEDAEEEERRRRVREQQEEEERTRRIIEELKVMRREELEQQRKADEESKTQRTRKSEEEEEEEDEDRLRMRKPAEEQGRRGARIPEASLDEFSGPVTPTPTPSPITHENHERTRILSEIEQARARRVELESEKSKRIRRVKRLVQISSDRRQRARDTWKKRFLEEKKRTPPREDKTKALKEELDNINRKILEHMEALKDGSKRTPYDQENFDDKEHTAKLGATKMEQEIEDLQHKLQSTKFQLTAEMKLRNQSEHEVSLLKSELEQLKANSPPRFEEKVTAKVADNPYDVNNGKEDEELETQYDPVAKKSTYRVTYKDPLDEDPSVAAPVASSVGSLEEAFRTFATKGNGAEATGADVFKWAGDAGIIGKSLNNHHVDISFHKIKPKGAKTITIKELYPLIDELAVKYRDDTKLSYQGARRRLIDKLASAPYKLHGATHTVRTVGVARLTNASKFSGSQKPLTVRGRTKQDGESAAVDSTRYVPNNKMAGPFVWRN